MFVPHGEQTQTSGGTWGEGVGETSCGHVTWIVGTFECYPFTRIH